MVMEGLQDDMGDGNLQCTDHPYKNHTTGGICAFCLQEKLGKLVSSSFPVAVFPSSSSSPSPSFRSDYGAPKPGHSLRLDQSSSSSANTVNLSSTADFHSHDQYYYSRRARVPNFLLSQRKKKKDLALAGITEHGSVVFKRSKSTTTPRRRVHFTGAEEGDEYSPRKRGFWSFLHLSKHSSNRKIDNVVDIPAGSTKMREEFAVVVEESESPDPAASDRKVSRSRSVGCGSRSFSGDFFERISTGFGDCTLRRVESQREGKLKATPHRGGGQDGIKERVKCGGIFSGFMVASSSSSSSSSSSYWVSSSAEDYNVNGKAAAAVATTTPAAAGHLVHGGRSKSWGWALASPIRAFSKPSSAKREASNKNTTPDLNAIPSLLSVTG